MPLPMLSLSKTPTPPLAGNRIYTHIHTISGKQTADSTGTSELEICSPQDSTVYHSCRISVCNCPHHRSVVSWNPNTVVMWKIQFRTHQQKVEKVFWAFWAFWRILKVKFAFSRFCWVQIYESHSAIVHPQYDGIFKLGIVFENRYSLVGYIS